jgi:hypothetical protein
MAPADAFKSMTTLSRFNEGMGRVQADIGNVEQTKVYQPPDSLFGQPSRRVGRLDLTSILEPHHQHPAAHGPGCTNAPNLREHR